MANRANEADRPYKSIHKAPVLRHPISKRLRDCGQGAVMTDDDKSADRLLKWIAKPLVPTERVRAPEWFIDGMLPENCLAVLYGQPGSFKTFAFIAVAMCLATGLPFCGRRTKQCNPLYIAADPDPDTPRERAQAWTIHHLVGFERTRHLRFLECCDVRESGQPAQG
jgi:AAA domain